MRPRPLRRPRRTSALRRADLESKKPVTVFAAGCFNRIHPAHLRLLRQARVLGDVLVVVLSHDSHNRKPHSVASSLRKKRLEALGVADRVVVGDPHGFAATLRREKPDLLVLGYDQRLPDVETEQAVRAMGVTMVVMPWYPGKEDPRDARCD